LPIPELVKSVGACFLDERVQIWLEHLVCRRQDDCYMVMCSSLKTVLVAKEVSRVRWQLEVAVSTGT
jgi:hypothetical protein